MPRPFAALLVSLLVLPHVIVAQRVTTAASLAPGARVRVTHPAEGMRVGTALAITNDLLFVRWADGSDTVGVPLAEVTRLDVSYGSHKYRALKYAGIGLVAGGALGAMLGAESYRSSDSFVGKGAFTAEGAFALGSLGALIGLFSGVMRSDTWHAVPLDRSRVGIVVPSGARGGIGLALAF